MVNSSLTTKQLLAKQMYLKAELGSIDLELKNRTAKEDKIVKNTFKNGKKNGKI